MNNVVEDICSTGIVEILTEEEADERILKYRKSKNRMKDDVNFINAHHYFISKRRSKLEVQLPREHEKTIDFWREGRDN